MFSRDRVCQFAVRGWLITGVLCLVALPALGQSDNPESSAPSKEATTEQGQPTVEPPAAAAPAPVKVPKQKAASPEQKALCDSPQTPKENDLCQQWRMAEAAEKQAKWTEFQFKATLAEIVALILTTRSASRLGVHAPQAARDDAGGRGGVSPAYRSRGDTPRWPPGASGRLSDGPASPAPPLLPRKREKRSYGCTLADAGH